MSELHLNDILEQHLANHPLSASFFNNVSKSLTSKVEADLLLQASKLSSLSFFNEVKKCSKLEDYLDFDILKKNKKLLTKFRCGDHKLLIRSGSWQKIERNERWCRFCNSHALEDEWHVTFECSTFHSKREEL